MEKELNEVQLRQQRAYLVLKKIITTEKRFLRNLTSITCDFPAFIKTADKKPIIPPQDLDNKIIGYSQSIKIFSEYFLQRLESRADSWNDLPKVSDVIIENAKYFKIFSIYTQQLVERYHYLEIFTYKYKKFFLALKEFESSQRFNNPSLRQCMLEPVNRLLQYKLLMEEYLIHQDACNGDYDDTQEVIRILDSTIAEASKPFSNLEDIISDFQRQIDSSFRGVVSPFLFRERNKLKYV